VEITVSHQLRFTMPMPLATEEPDDEFFNDDDMRVGLHSSGDDNDDEESTGLVFRAEPFTQNEFSGMRMDYHNEEDEDQRMCPVSFRNVVLMVCVFAILAVLVPGIRSKSETREAVHTPTRIPVRYDCPPSELSISQVPEDFYETMEDRYMNSTMSITTNMNEFLTTFRDSHYDDWGQTYEEVKDGMKHFKSKYFPPYLQDGSTIYESACGIGLNLYMTLEILQEVAGIENLFVYGNELVEVSAEKANAVYDHVPPAFSRNGVICPASSLDLGFIPANSFDLVYTGYISPLNDPLNFGLESDVNYDRYETLCESSSEEEWAEAALNEVAQSRQNEWYGRWVAEMARIAKPGVPVIVEQVSAAYCDDYLDWGGVRREWWLETATKDAFGWDVDPSSLVFEDDIVFEGRYHVFMLKNGKREN
jgi:hypothetical protein